MPFFHGDRVCTRYPNSDKLRLGRVQILHAYVEDLSQTQGERSTEEQRDGDGKEDANVEVDYPTPPASPERTVIPMTPPASPERTVIPMTPIASSQERTVIPMTPTVSQKLSVIPDTPPPVMVKVKAQHPKEHAGARGFPSPVMVTKPSPLFSGDGDDKVDKDGGDDKIRVGRDRHQIVWDDGSGTKKLEWFDDGVFRVRVIDRKFTVGQRVFRGGLRGKVTDVIPLATVKVWNCADVNNVGINSKTKSVRVVPDVGLADIRPVTPFFHGVNVEYKGWIGLIIEVRRSVTYKLEELVNNQDTFTFEFYDSLQSDQPRKTPSKSKSKRSTSKYATYPFLPSAGGHPYKGIVKKLNRSVIQQEFRKREREDKENCHEASNNNNDLGKGSTAIVPGSPTAYPAGSSLSITERKKTRSESVTGTVESVSVVSIKVRWTGRLPAYLIKACSAEKPSRMPRANANGSSNESYRVKVPPPFICEQDLKFVRPLYVHPVLYFDKMGLCVCSSSVTSGLIVSEKTWATEMYTGLLTHKDAERPPFDLNAVAFSPPPPPRAALKALGKDSEDNAASAAGKRKQCEGDDEKAGSKGDDIIVCKHFVRHMYKVIWEPPNTARRSYFCPEGDTGLYYGSQLEPDLSQEHKLCLGLIHSHLYVVAKKGTPMDGLWDYGVVSEKPTDDSVVVEWLKIRSDGSAVTDRVLKCNLVEIDNHPTFNMLHEGKIVIKREDAAKYKHCKQFSFGTVVSVHRFSLGQISVYCPIQKKVVLMWPHMLEVFVEMPMKDLIAHNVVGHNKEALQVDES